MMNIAVIGTGYVGLTTGITLAYLGHRVTGVDLNVHKISLLSAGSLPIYEPGLDELMKAAGGRLQFTSSYEQAIADADIVFIAVGTPEHADGSPNLDYLHACVSELIPHLSNKRSPTLIVNKSTVPVGTADRMAARFSEAGLCGLAIVASNPEFLRQGSAVRDTLYPERIVIGGGSFAACLLAELYAPILEQQFEPPSSAPRTAQLQPPAFIAVDRKSAELAKYAANAFLAMKISYMNEIANLCDRVGADVEEVARVIGSDARIGPAFLRPGIGYGGSCFPKDTNALHHIAAAEGCELKLLSAVIEVNNRQRQRIVEKAKQKLGSLQGRKLAILGLTFKPGTDDLRNAPSIPIIHELAAEGARVYVHDPVSLGAAVSLLPDSVRPVVQLEDALRDAEALLLLTEWPMYLGLDAEYLRTVMKRPLLIDGRNAWGKQKRMELEYCGIGIPASPASSAIQPPAALRSVR